MEKQEQDQILLELFDEVHDTVHMLRHMAGHYLEKAEDLEMNLASAVRLQLVDLGSMDTLRNMGSDVADVVSLFPKGASDELDQ